MHEPEVGIRHHKLVYGNRWRDHCLEIVRYIQASELSKFVISEEAWSRPATNQQLNFLINSLKSQNIQVQGVLYLRNYYDFVISFYRELCIRRNNQKYFNEFFQVFKQGIFNYTKVAQLLSTAFQGEVKFYDTTDIDDVTVHFLAELGVDQSTLNQPTDIKRYNNSAGPIESEIKRSLNLTESNIDMANIQQTAHDYFSEELNTLNKRYIEDTTKLPLIKDDVLVEFNKITGFAEDTSKNLFSDNTQTGKDKLESIRPDIEQILRILTTY